MRCLIQCLLPLALAVAALPCSAKVPNVLFLFTDDQRQETIGAWGNEDIRTPHIDRLSRDGLSFRNAYIMGASSPAVCSPSRACLFSGRTLWNLECQGEFGFEISGRFKTLPQVFRESGYETFGTGKNEPGKDGHFARSFSAGEAILFKGMTRSQYRLQLHDFAPDGDYRKKPVLTEGRHSAEIYADACIRFLQKQSPDGPKPFFAYVAFQTPHDPLNVPEDYLARYDPTKIRLLEPFQPQHAFNNGMLEVRDESLIRTPRSEEAVRRHLAAYYALVEYTDAQIGRILKVLDERGLTENTLIVFASDNGLALGSHGLLGKQSVYEHSVKVPLILAGPGIPQGEVRRQLCYLYDIYPTLCDLAGLKTPQTVEYRSLFPLVADPKAPHREHLVFAFMSWQRSVRDARHKLIEYAVDGVRRTQLFDLNEDPFETNNLAGSAEHRETLLRLRGLLEAERVKLNDGNTPYPFSNAQGVSFWSAYEEQ